MQKVKIALVVAGGKGERMNTDIPKQFMEIQGKPVLMHTLEAFLRYDASVRLIVILPLAQITRWESLCKKHAFEMPHQIIAGGHTRFQSVKNGLDSIEMPALIAVHDGVRPLVSIETIARCFDTAEKFGIAIPVVDLVDSIRQITAEGSLSVDRTAYKLVQTPQVFDSRILKKAYEQSFSALFTDDASVVEALIAQPYEGGEKDEYLSGIKIHLVEGNRENIKITTRVDLEMAEVLIKFENLKI